MTTIGYRSDRVTHTPAQSPTKQNVLHGGSFLRGKTSNIDLDSVMQRYLPPGSWTCADIVRSLTPAIAAEIELRAQSRAIYMPLFARHHWVAGIFFKGTIELFDSAPSPPVRKDIYRLARQFWPNATISAAHCPHQRRDSEDCGIFALATFIAHANDVRIKLTDDLTTRLRQIFASACPPPLAAICATLRPPTATLRGGSSDTDTAWRAASRLEGPASVQNLCAALAAMALLHLRDNRPPPSLRTVERAVRKKWRPSSKTRDGQDIFPQMDIGDVWSELTNDAVALLDDDGNLVTPPQPHPTTNRFLVLGTTRSDSIGYVEGGTLRETLDVNGDTATFLLGATYRGMVEQQGHSYSGHFAVTNRPALAMAGVYELRHTTPPPGDNHGSREDPDDEVTETSGPTHPAIPDAQLVATLKTAVVGDRVSLEWKPSRPNQKVRRWTGTVEGAWHDKYGSLSVLWDAGLPLFEGSRRRVLPEARLPDPELVYIRLQFDRPSQLPPPKAPAKREAAKPAAPKPTATNKSQQRHQPAPALPPTRPADSGTHAEVLADPPVAPLHPNEKGRPDEGSVCPRLWYIYPDKPPHVSLLAWNAVSESTRNQQRRWIRDLRSMPADLLSRSLPTAALELVRRISVARRWRWSTHARALANVQSALSALPLYTNQLRGVNLDAFPEWRQAKRTAVRYEKEVPPNPPPPLSPGQFEKLLQSLAHNPRARLFATLLWSFAARAGDIGGLRRQAVQENGRTQTGDYKVTFTYRTGKGTRFRGPYDAPSVLKAEDMAELQRAMIQVAEADRIFPDTTSLRTAIRHKMKEIDQRLSLPSVRKGSARHMAKMGMPEADIARIMGHTTVDTLRRYLGYGENPTIEAHNLQERLGRLQHKPRQ
jgi:integrase